jgi:hypothetical protein
MITIPVPVRVPVIAVAVSTIVTPATTMTHVLARRGSMGAISHRVIDTDATPIEFLSSSKEE